jgi:hypothetical protein
MNRTVNHRVEARYGPITAERIGQLKDAIFDEALRGEQPDDPRIAPSAITREVMEQGIRAVGISSLRRWGLTLHHGDADAEPVIQVLEHRYGFWADDIPHVDPFQGLLAAAT